ncbi:unnamed protein product [Lota lota]
MADQVESDRRDDAKEKNVWYPLRKWWRPYWAFNQDFGQTPLQDSGDLWWGMDLLQRGGSSGRPWPECTSSPLIVPLHPGSGYGCPPGPGGGEAEQYKWRVVLDVAHFTPSEIWIGTAGGVLEIRGKHKERSDEHGFIARCFTRKYRLPIGIDLSKITSILSGDGIMYVEAPLTEFTAPANIVIPIQVEREDAELRQGEEYPEDNAASPVAAPTAPGDPGSAAPEPPTEVTDHGEASLASVEAHAGSTMDEPLQHDMGRKQEEQEEEEKKEEEVKEVKEQEARGEVAEESSSAAGPGEGPENLPELMEHHQAPEESPESLENPGTTPSDQKEEAGNALLEPQPEESSGETAVEATQIEVPTEGESPSNQDITSEEPLAADTE